jgi:hypothetical protein
VTESVWEYEMALKQQMGSVYAMQHWCRGFCVSRVLVQRMSDEL